MYHTSRPSLSCPLYSGSVTVAFWRSTCPALRRWTGPTSLGSTWDGVGPKYTSGTSAPMDGGGGAISFDGSSWARDGVGANGMTAPPTARDSITSHGELNLLRIRIETSSFCPRGLDRLLVLTGVVPRRAGLLQPTPDSPRRVTNGAKARPFITRRNGMSQSKALVAGAAGSTGGDTVGWMRSNEEAHEEARSGR